MKLLDYKSVPHDLTYSDVFLVPQYTEVESRMDVDLRVSDASQINIPVIVANMNSVAGKRMSETVARRGGLTILPQDIPLDVLKNTISDIKKSHLIYETPIVLEQENTLRKALSLIHKRSHKAVVIVDSSNSPVGIFTEKDAGDMDSFTELKFAMNQGFVNITEGVSPEEVFRILHSQNADIGIVVNEAGKLLGVMSKKSALRTMMYKPAVNKKGQLKVAVALGINGDIEKRAADVLDAGADILVIDTAHGDQTKMYSALKKVRALAKNIPIAVGNVVTAEATARLIKAGADIVKVGVGPGAMCTTRMMTGVGRPQFSAIMECATQARKMGKHVWADGGIRHPRDVALCLAAGASSSFFASWMAGTYESAGDILFDHDGRAYKESYGMASKRAVLSRTKTQDALERAKKELFEEGISTSKMYINSDTPGVEDIIDQIITGLRSSMSYTGAKNLEEFYDKAVVGIQSPAGYHEGTPLRTSW